MGDGHDEATDCAEDANITISGPEKAFIHRQRQLLRNWIGSRDTIAGLIIGRAPDGWLRRTVLPRFNRGLGLEVPITTFWVLQHGNELALLFENLSKDMPVYGLRTSHPLAEADDPLFRTVVALYVDEIRQIQPHGPYYIGGACQGSILAVAVARALRAQDSIALVTIIDFDLSRAFRHEAYDGKVAIIAAERIRFNPNRIAASPERDWRHLLAGEISLQVIDADYAKIFTPATARTLALAVVKALIWASSKRASPPSEDRLPAST